MLNGYEYKYYRFLKKRERQYRVDFSQFRVKQVDGLVSVVLPVYNGEDYIEASIQSIVSQTYKKFELIIIDDGSVDRTAEIVDAWAKRDKRIVAVHQKNSKLPRALNNGFSLAKGEYLTWTSADNKMHPDCIEKLADYLKRNPKVAMCYANLRAIDSEGQPITSNAWYSRGEHTGNVYLPNATLRLNTYAENTVAAAFMYRRAVPLLLGGYEPALYMVEDYDYWMRINDTFLLTHTDFDDIIYDYRFHEKSLTANAKELRINEIREKLMLTEDYRQDWLLRPMCWVLNSHADAEKWKQIANEAGHLSQIEEEADALCWPELGTGVVQVTVKDGNGPVQQVKPITQDAIRVLVCKGDIQEYPTADFDFFVQINDRPEDVPEGWIQVSDEKCAFDIIQIYCKMRWFEQMCARNRDQEDQPKCKATIVLCTYKRIDKARQALDAMLKQSLKPEAYEILVVNNDTSSNEMKAAVEQILQNMPDEKRVRYIDCPYPGLSAARNFSLYAARGEILVYIDDDGLMERDCLEQLVAAFDSHPDAGVIGGQILLKDADQFSAVVLPGYESLWSERRYEQKTYFEATEDYDFPYGCNYAVRRSVLRELGGFRISYGRLGKDFAGGEEMVLSHLIKKSGMKIGAEPRAIVLHDVDASRFTLEHVRQTMRASRLTNRLMKMDLYRQYDPGMKEEQYLLQSAQECMAQLEQNGITDSELRYQYCKFDIEATQEAIEEGNRDLQIMESMEGSAHEEENRHGQNERSLANQIVGIALHVGGKIFGNTRLGKKAQRMEEELAVRGIKGSFKRWVRAAKKRIKSVSKRTILEELKKTEHYQHEFEQRCLGAIRDTKDYVYDSEQRCLNAIRDTEDNLHDFEQRCLNAIRDTKDNLHDFEQRCLNAIRDTKDNLHDSEQRCLNAIRDTKDYVYDFEQRLIWEDRREKINELRQKKKILLIGTSEHENIGDAAITLAEQELLLEQFPEYEQVEFSTYSMDTMYDYLQAIVHKDDIFFLHGGGNLGNRYMAEEALRRRVMQDFPEREMIILPQTIGFTEDAAGREQLEISKKVYNQHKGLTIFVRGNKSLHFAKEHFFNARVELMPDMAFFLKQRDYGFDRAGILVCLRNDTESRLDEQMKRDIAAVARKMTDNVEITTNMGAEDIRREVRASRVNVELKRFAGKKVVVTDRLHGLIFASITGTPVVAIKSKDQKLEEYCDAFFADSNAVFYIGTELEKVEEAVKAALCVKRPCFPALKENRLAELRTYLSI